MSAFLFCFGAALLGIYFVRRLFDGILDEAEQLLSGVIVGWMICVWCAYLLARAMGHLSYGAMLALTAIICVAAVYLWWPQLAPYLRRQPPQQLQQNRSARVRFWRAKNAPLVSLLILCAPLYYYFFSMRMLEPQADGLYSGANSWNDMAWHIAISSSFLYGQNFPPAYTPLYAAQQIEPLRYPFLPDFHTALLMQLGIEPWTALMLTAVPLALVITGLFYCLARRMTNRAATSLIATALFLLNGGLGFLYFFEDWRNSKEGLFAFLSHLERNYANMWDKQLHWANIIVDSFLPHRASLYGIPLTLTIFILFAAFWQQWNTDEPAKRREHEIAASGLWAKDAWAGWRTMLAAGILTGLVPLFHSHSYITLGLISGFLFLLRPRRVWLAFWLPAVLLAVPQLTGAPTALASRHFLYLQLNWKGNTEANWPLYWLRNLGLPLLMIVPAWLGASRIWRTFYLAFAFLMLFCVIVMISPHDYDNIKIMYYWYGLSCILIASWLVTIASRYKQRFVAALLFTLCIASGALALQRERLIHWRMFSTEEMTAAAFVREHTAPHALFLTAPIHNQPVLCLAGRPILLGYGGWLWTHGYEFQQREQDAKAIFAGAPNALQLLDKYGVDYLYISARERNDQKANAAFLQQNFPVIYSSGDIAIYDARKRLTNGAARQ